MHRLSWACADAVHPVRGRVMSYVMVDVESDGPIPGDYSMVCFGAIIVEPTLEKTFYGQQSLWSYFFQSWLSLQRAGQGHVYECG